MTVPVIVAIPARDEANHITSCLNAIASQPGAERNIAAVILFANNCADETAAIARSLSLPYPLQVIEASFPPEEAHIGHARRGATNAAFNCKNEMGLDDPIIAGTDADSLLASDWLPALLKAFTGNIDAVCGAIDVEDNLAPSLSSKLYIEATYSDAVARVSNFLDPLPHDPWPNHIWCWGANFAVRASILLAAGGTPLVSLAEDRALHAELLRRDARIRHSQEVRVHTSSRDVGRAPGGLADLMRNYADDPNAEADYFLEPARLTIERARLRGNERQRWGETPGFGAHWQELEVTNPFLTPKRVRLAALETETKKLEMWLNTAKDRSGSPVGAQR